MNDGNHTPDAPFHGGNSGKYKLLIKNVTPKFGRFEYELVDADGKEYSAQSELHFETDQLLRCLVSFEVVNAKLVVAGTTICKKQDLATPVPVKKKVSVEKIPAAKPMSKPKPAKPDSPFVIIDALQDQGKKTGPMTEEEIQVILKQIEIQKDKRYASYRCCGKTHYSLFDFRKHLNECHNDEYRKIFVNVLHRSAPSTVRGVGVAVSNSPTNKREAAKRENAVPHRVKGEYFHLIYTPMGNKR